MSELVPRSYVGAHTGFRSGADTPRDFLERCLACMEEWEKEIHAFVSTNIPAARAAADRSTERWRNGRALSAIDGIPIGIKDIIETADMPTEQGSPLFKGWRSVRDSAAVSALREAGAVIVGKTVTTEFAAVHPGPTRNPWDTTRTPGGRAAGLPLPLRPVWCQPHWGLKSSARSFDLRAIADVMAISPAWARSTAEEVSITLVKAAPVFSGQPWTNFGSSPVRYPRGLVVIRALAASLVPATHPPLTRRDRSQSCKRLGSHRSSLER